ncbi:MAG: Holliday junction branch migration protein RuvA [Bacteroidetes bacterium]|nr:MAG: Holliday junction branch migration protein RuvA [Bacteroidota bacterium]
MYNSLYGTYSGRSASALYLHNNGIEWSLSASERTIQNASLLKDEIRIYTYLHHKEDTMVLYGFINERERQVFLELNKVSGIGPKQALRMLSGIGTEELVAALDDGNTERLSMLPGIGKKTAAKIILALRGKLKLEFEDKLDDKFSDLIEALAGMGFDKKAAKKALNEISGRNDFSTMESDILEKELFREAIVFLSSRG